VVIGGKNSSNTYQLFRLCEQRLGPSAFFIQSEASIAAPDRVEHFVYGGSGSGRTETRPLWTHPESRPRRVLVTGGASCPDGIIQQVICRINSFFPADKLRTIADVLGDLQP
jgi:4-hydroxy-3-methylbut-2-enyl diphosphate reductase